MGGQVIIIIMRAEIGSCSTHANITVLSCTATSLHCESTWVSPGSNINNKHSSQLRKPNNRPCGAMAGKSIAEHEETASDPGQSEFCKACLAGRTKVVAACGTECHTSRLELLLTSHILGELSREGPTFFRPESVAKEGGGEGKDETEKTGKKKKTDPEAKPGPKKKPRKTKKAEGEEAGGEDEDDEDEQEDPKPKKKPRKGKKVEDEDDAGRK